MAQGKAVRAFFPTMYSHVAAWPVTAVARRCSSRRLRFSPHRQAAWRAGPGGGLLGHYSEERLTPSRWAISVTRSSAEQARDVALYRGAILARATGHSYIQLVSFRIQGINWITRGTYSRGSTIYILTALAQIEGADDVAAPLHCEASIRGSPLCMTVSVEEVLAACGPRLGQTPEEIEADVAAARRAAASHSRR